MAKYVLSAFGDEIASDMQTQMQVLSQAGIGYIEARGVNGANVADLTVEQAKFAKNELDEKGFNLSALGSPLAKSKINEPFEQSVDMLKHLAVIGEIFGTKNIRTFSFYPFENQSYDDMKNEVHARISELVRVADGLGITLLLENDCGLYADNAARMKEIALLAQSVSPGALHLTFDPSNFLFSNQNTLEAFDLLKEHIGYFHIKDCDKEKGVVVPSGEGDGHILEILTAFNEYTDKEIFLSIEPHLGVFPGMEKFEHILDLSALPEGGPRFFMMAYEGIRSILSKIK